MITCAECGRELQRGESCNHIPDFFLNVWNCQALLYRSIEGKDGVISTEGLPFNMPERWINWILDTCGGAINMSGMYHLPGRVWEWVLSKSRGDKKMASFLEKEIDKYLEGF